MMAAASPTLRAAMMIFRATPDAECLGTLLATGALLDSGPQARGHIDAWTAAHRLDRRPYRGPEQLPFHDGDRAGLARLMRDGVIVDASAGLCERARDYQVGDCVSVGIWYCRANRR